MFVSTTTLVPVEITSAIVRNPLVATPETSVMDAITLMSSAYSCGGSPRQDIRSSFVVVMEQECVVGLLTDQDIVSLNAQQQSLEHLTLRQVMTGQVMTCHESALTDLLGVTNLLQVMEQRLVCHLAVTREQGTLLGIVTDTHLRQALNLLKHNQLVKKLEKKVSFLETENVVLSETCTVELELNRQQLQDKLHTQQKAEASLEDQNRLLAKIAKGQPLKDILNAITNTVELKLSGAICSILLLSSENRLYLGSAPSLPPELNQAVEGLLIGEGVGSCGTAAFRNATVTVDDIATDPLWQNGREIALKYGLRACWSLPIVASDGRVLGTFAVYYKEVRSPQPFELELLQRMANIAEIAIERKQTEAALKESKACWQFALEVAGDGIWDWNIETNQVFFSQQWKAMLGYADHEVGSTVMEWDHRVYPDDKAYCYSELQKHFRGEIPAYQAEHRLLSKDGSYKWILARGKVIEWDKAGQPRRIIGTQTDLSARKLAEEQLQNLIEGTASTTGEDFFPALASYITKVLNVPYAFVSERIGQTLHTLAFCANGILQPNFSFSLAKTPCERAVEHGTYYCQNLVQDEFPEHLDLVTLEAESYLGIALCNTQGQSIGNLCILGKQPIEDPIRAEQILRVFAGRATAELERERAIKALEQLNQELETKVAERTAALQVSERRYRALMNGASDAIILADPQGNVVEVNQRFIDLLGYTREELTKLNISCLHPPDVLAAVKENFQNMMAHQVTSSLETDVLRADGHRVPVEISASCIDLDGDYIGQAIFRDVSQRKQLEVERQQVANDLRQSQQFLQMVLDLFPLSVFWKNRDSVYLGCNQNFLDNAGLSSINDIIGKTDYDLPWGNTEAEAYRADDQQVIASNLAKLGIIETQLSANNLQIWLETNKLPLHDFEGKIIGVLGTYQDITPRKQAEFQLQQTNEQLLRATRLKDEFLANMSHELRTPLNAILGMTEGLYDQIFGEINQPQAKALQTISRSAAHLLELINDILDVAKIESGQIELERAPTNVALLCRSSLAFINQQALKKRIQIETKIPFDLTDLYVDERRIRQVLINLLNNAVKFTPEGGCITIEICRELYPLKSLDAIIPSAENFLYISIVDTGIGIAPAQIDKLFKPFIQIDSALNRQYTGTGLGLALVKRIVELHGGRVGLTSEVGIGSCFTVALPYTTSNISFSSIQVNSCSNQEVSQLEQTITPLILLAEDNESNIVTISSYLGANGYNLLVAKNGQEAITMAQAKKPDLILMDIQMPEMDGLEAIQQIRSNPALAKTPIIALTALAMPGDRERCLAAGANDYMSKPIRLKHLANTIQQLLFS